MASQPKAWSQSSLGEAVVRGTLLSLVIHMMIHSSSLPIGIGLAIAAALAKSGATKVYILGRRIGTLNDAVKSIAASEGVVVPITCDISNPSSINTAVEQIQNEIGYVDVLINNAGITGPNNRGVNTAKSISELQENMLSDWPSVASTFAINTSSVVGVSASFLPLLDAANARRGWVTGKMEPGGVRVKNEVEGMDSSDKRTSQIITVASIAAFDRVVASGLPYIASKVGAVQLAKVLATLLGPWGLRSNVIAPGSEFHQLPSLLFERSLTR